LLLHLLFNAVPGLGSCSTRNIASILSKSQDTYVYLFAHPTQETIPLPGDGKGAVTVGHATEIPYVFGDVWAFPNFKDESDLAFEMGTYWINFAKYGSPNSVQSLPKWPKYDNGVDLIIRFDVSEGSGGGGIAVQKELRKKACDWQVMHRAPMSMP